jgi:hypothetical protein
VNAKGIFFFSVHIFFLISSRVGHVHALWASYSTSEKKNPAQSFEILRVFFVKWLSFTANFLGTPHRIGDGYHRANEEGPKTLLIFIGG